ncbi:autoinducer synthase [Sphingomonas oleivorans]|uniref:Acyl-homoserine-lactone synthase n=1 Tax=Sphingomonas oleivorans TaxID=1735121 RepID=A0A2T5FUQ8_9SPHN|nr:acyl-homoserine-lactone synthase [Sphingomonas oleivorans]PTQ08261.1 autoinducer synthase [Sphingomonas oleivorans]
MIRLITSDNRSAYPSLVQAMHADRKRVFVDMLRWNIAHDECQERDEFDDEFAEYLILHDPSTGEHLASMRLLRTDRPHLLSSAFAHLCDKGVPSSCDIFEITRFCVAPRGRAADRRAARNRLVRAMVEYALLTDIRAFTAVCNMRFLSEVLSAGWRCRPLGLPMVEQGELVGALMIEIDTATLGSLIGPWRCDPVDLRLVGRMHRALAA